MHIFYFSSGNYSASAIAPNEACARIVAAEHKKILEPTTPEFINGYDVSVTSEPVTHRTITKQEWLETMVSDSAKNIMRSMGLI